VAEVDPDDAERQPVISDCPRPPHWWSSQADRWPDTDPRPVTDAGVV